MINIIQEDKNDILIKPPKIGDTVEGKIIGIGRSSVFVDLGPQGTGIIFGKEYLEAKNKLENLKKQDKIFAKVIDLENENGYLELSVVKASKELIWEELRQKKEQSQTIKVKISGANKGGLLANVDEIPAFLPVSQLSSSHYPQLGAVEESSLNENEIKETVQQKILKELQKFIGKDLEVKIYELLPREEKLILSEKAKELESIKEILKNYKEGDIVEGKVSKIVNFGAFVKFQIPSKILEKTKDLPQELEGLVYISELDWELVKDPNKILKEGEKVKVKIINIDQGRISLSLKALKPNPWDGIEKKYKKGDIVKGKVVKLDSFGALIRLPVKIQGLCHISEFGVKAKMEEKLKIGENYDFKILSLDPNEHKMLLKLA